MAIDDLQRLLAYYTVLTTIFAVLMIVVTLFLLRKDKHFALALSFGEVAMYVAISTFGQAPLSRAALAVGGFNAEISLSQSSEPPYFASVLVIFLAGALSTVMMALRTWDKQIPKNPDS